MKITGRRFNLVIVTLAISWASASIPGSARDTSAGGSAEIHLRAVTFDPLQKTAAAALTGRPEPWRSLAAPDHLVLIQFTAPPIAAWLETLAGEGVTLFDYIPRNAYIARIGPALRRRIATRPFVRAIVPYLPAFRVAPGLLSQAPSAGDGTIRLVVMAAPGIGPDHLAAQIAGVAPRSVPLGSGRYPGATLVEIEIERADLTGLLTRLAAIPELFWIDERRPFLPHNDAMRGVLQTGSVSSTRLFDRGLTGSGQIMGESDTGLDSDHCFFLDPAASVSFELIDPDSPPATPLTNPTHRKVLAYQYHAGSNQVDQSGHGTHVAGTAAGDDLANPASGTDPGLDQFDGMAPGARLVFQDIDKQGGFLDVPVNLYGFLQAAYNAGARIHTNSWGAATNTYTSDASQVDRFSWDHPDILFFFSAGNNGPAAESVGAPGIAKNVVTVGMVETPASGDPDNLEAGSSNGPTSDGRRKPDVVNVGGFPIPSAGAGTACGLANFGGTSMATPGVAGGAALIRQYLTDGFYPHGYAGSGPALSPSAALLKALVVNSAVNIGGTNVDAPIPDNSQGWGRVLLDNALFFPSDLRRLVILRDDDVSSGADGFTVGATVEETFQVSNCRTDVPIEVTLVWTDPPVAPASEPAWVNDLDLEVEGPGGTLYLGNVFSNGASVTGGTADDRNNVEQVLLPTGVAVGGTYTIRVRPSNVAVGPQPYALVVTGDVSAAPLPRLAVTSAATTGGCDGDLFLDEGETLSIAYTIQNDGCGNAGALDALLTVDTTLPAIITPAQVTFGGPAAGSSTQVSFDLTLGDTGAACGGELPLLLTLQAPDGGRWEHPHTQPLRLDPASGTRLVLDDVESGDQSAAAAPDWQINSCAVSSGLASWHLGDADCGGIPRDAAAHSLVFEVTPGSGEILSSASFVHAFDGYSNASFTDSVHFEIDHDLDGSFAPVASWSDGAAPTAMSPAGPFDLSPFNTGRAASVRFRFRFQSAALWVGPNSAPGWSVDDFQVNLETFAACDVNSKLPPPGIGDTLFASTAGSDLVLIWNAVPGAATYRVLRSLPPDFAAVEEFLVSTPGFNDPAPLDDPRSFLYQVRSVSACGVTSLD